MEALQSEIDSLKAALVKSKNSACDTALTPLTNQQASPRNTRGAFGKEDKALITVAAPAISIPDSALPKSLAQTQKHKALLEPPRPAGMNEFTMIVNKLERLVKMAGLANNLLTNPTLADMEACVHEGMSLDSPRALHSGQTTPVDVADDSAAVEIADSPTPPLSQPGTINPPATQAQAQAHEMTIMRMQLEAANIQRDVATERLHMKEKLFTATLKLQQADSAFHTSKVHTATLRSEMEEVQQQLADSRSQTLAMEREKDAILATYPTDSNKSSSFPSKKQKPTVPSPLATPPQTEIEPAPLSAEEITILTLQARLQTLQAEQLLKTAALVASSKANLTATYSAIAAPKPTADQEHNMIARRVAAERQATAERMSAELRARQQLEVRRKEEEFRQKTQQRLDQRAAIDEAYQLETAMATSKYEMTLAAFLDPVDDTPDEWNLAYPPRSNAHPASTNGEVSTGLTRNVVQTVRDVDTVLTRQEVGAAKASAPAFFTGSGDILMWLSQVANYLTQSGAARHTWAGFAQTYLSENTFRTWQHALYKLPAPHSWETFCKVMTTQYGVIDPERKARHALKGLRQGTNTAAEFDRSFRALLSQVNGIDENTLIDQYLCGLSAQLQDKCSHNRQSMAPWESLEDLSRVAIMEDASTKQMQVLTNSNTQLPRSVAAIAPKQALAGKRLRGSSSDARPPNQQPSGVVAATQRPPVGGYSSVTGNGPDTPAWPNTQASIDYFRGLGRTTEIHPWHVALKSWLKHVRMYALCNFCGAARHTTGTCTAHKHEYVIPPLIEKKIKGPAVMGSRGAQ